MDNQLISKTDYTINSKSLIIGAGFARTGTLSLKTAIDEILKLGPCYHMGENIIQDDSNFWYKAYKGEKCNWEDIFTKYNATTDHPACIFWEEILKQYPDSKVILTIRNPESWYKSCSETVFNYDRQFGYYGLRILDYVIPFLNRFRNMIDVMWGYSFKYNFSKENTIKAFIDHNENVKKLCPKDKLLLFEAKDGWEPLCKFLNVSIPNVPYPNVNDTNRAKCVFRFLNIFGWMILIIGILFSYYVFKYINN